MFMLIGMFKILWDALLAILSPKEDLIHDYMDLSRNCPDESHHASLAEASELSGGSPGHGGSRVQNDSLDHFLPPQGLDPLPDVVDENGESLGPPHW